MNAGRIICMDKGVIVEQGTHEELIKNKGRDLPIFIKVAATQHNLTGFLSKITRARS